MAQLSVLLDALAEVSRGGSMVEKHINAIFAKLGLEAEPHVNRRVSAVLTYPRDNGLRT